MRLQVLCCAGLLVACQPTLNWREIRIDTPSLLLMLPCKPDRGSRTVDLAGRQVTMSMVGCESGGNTFALAWTAVPAGMPGSEWMGHWKQATLANMRAVTPAKEVSWTAPTLPQGLLVQAAGLRPDGAAVQSQAGYLVHGGHVFQAVVYGTRLDADATEPFFGGLKFP
jgi:hypothetical protein